MSQKEGDEKKKIDDGKIFINSSLYFPLTSSDFIFICSIYEEQTSWCLLWGSKMKSTYNLSHFSESTFLFHLLFQMVDCCVCVHNFPHTLNWIYKHIFHIVINVFMPIWLKCKYFIYNQKREENLLIMEISFFCNRFNSGTNKNWRNELSICK